MNSISVDRIKENNGMRNDQIYVNIILNKLTMKKIMKIILFSRLDSDIYKESNQNITV